MSARFECLHIISATWNCNLARNSVFLSYRFMQCAHNDNSGLPCKIAQAFPPAARGTKHEIFCSKKQFSTGMTSTTLSKHCDNGWRWYGTKIEFDGWTNGFLRSSLCSKSHQKSSFLHVRPISEPRTTELLSLKSSSSWLCCWNLKAFNFLIHFFLSLGHFQNCSCSNLFW